MPWCRQRIGIAPISRLAGYLLQSHRASDHEQDLFQIVDQLNHGLHLVEDEQERMQIARLNLQAAHRAAAFDVGLAYAKAGLELLGEDAWEQDYRLTLALHEQAALTAFAAGDIPCMEQHSEQVLQFGRNPLDLARVQGMRMEFLIASKRYSESLDMGLEVLRVLGQEFPSDPEWAFTLAEMNSTNDRFQRESSDLLTKPPLCDQDPAASCDCRDPAAYRNGGLCRPSCSEPTNLHALPGTLLRTSVSPGEHPLYSLGTGHVGQ